MASSSPEFAMSSLLDTTIFVDVLRGNQKALLFVESQQSLKVSYVTAGELLQGVRNSREMKQVSMVVNSLPIDWGNEKIHRTALELQTQFSASKGMKLWDAVIAATAIVRGSVLYTHNSKDFRFIPNLDLRVPEYVSE